MDRLAVFFSMISLALAYLFVAEIGGGFRAARLPIAEVSYSTGTVRRLPSQRILWDRVSDGSTLSLGDTIATTEQAYARISFLQGAELHMNPSSMIVLRPDREALQISFLRGTGHLHVLERAKAWIGSSQASVDTVPDAEAGRMHSEQLAPAHAGLLPVFREPLGKKEANGLHLNGDLLSLSGFPGAPWIEKPEDQAFIDFNLKKSVELRYHSGSNTDGRAPASYEIRFDSVDTMAPPKIIQSPAESFALRIRDLPTGEYTWSVRALNAEGKRSRPSPSRAIRIRGHKQARQPQVLSPVIEDER